MLLAFCKLNEDSANVTKELAEKLSIKLEYDLNPYLNSNYIGDFYIALTINNINLQFAIYSTWEVEVFRYKCIPVIELEVYECYVKRIHESFLEYKESLRILQLARENLIEEIKHL